MSSSSSRPRSENQTAASTEALPATPADAARPTAAAAPDDGTGTVFQAEPPRAATDLTEYQSPPARQEAADLSGTIVQRLSDRLLSETISRRMQAAGYKLLKPIGEGTYGAVWLAEEQSTGVKVAIKFFAHGAGQRWEMLQEEVKQLAALDSAQGIVHLRDAVADADPPYYVMSYAEGGSLAQRLEKGPLPVAEALAIFQDVVQALAYVHAHGIRHCDLKPGNILLDRLGKPLVADFGQAHLSNDATPALGTFFYMAPEQADLGSQIPDTRWDVYGLGALMYAMLTGQPPRKDPNLSGELKNTVELTSRLRRYREGIAGTPKPIAHHGVRGVDHRLAHIIDACLELDPKKRLSSAEAILQALKRRHMRIRQRPMMVAGVVAPLLILLLMSLTGFVLFSSELKGSKDTLISRTLDGDKATAQLAANGLSQGLPNRIAELEGWAGDTTGDLLRTLLQKPRGQGVGDDDVVKALGDLTGHKGRTSQDFSGLLVLDRDGYIRGEIIKDLSNGSWGPPPDRDDVWARNWAWREWFNGREDLDQGAPAQPLSAPHISQAYKPVVQYRGDCLINISVPLREGKDGPVLGVLVGSMRWEKFDKWLKGTTIPYGQLVVFTDRGQPLRHKGAAGADDAPPEVFPQEYAKQLARQLTPDKDTAKSFSDPFPGGKSGQLAGYVLFDPNPSEAKKTGDLAGYWGVVVEQNPEQILAPVENLRQRVFFVATLVLVVAIVLTGGVWWFLLRLLRRQERLGNG